MRQRRILGSHEGSILPLHGGESRLSDNRRRRKKRFKRNKNCFIALGISVTIMGVIVVGFLRLSPNGLNSVTSASDQSDALHQIRCDDGNTVVGRINDDYCDCPDGSDEKLTSACSNVLVHKGTFRCRDDSSILLFPSRVRDGVKDCADGSDED